MSTDTFTFSMQSTSHMFIMCCPTVSQKRKRGQQSSKQGGKSKRGRAAAAPKRPQNNEPGSDIEVNSDDNAGETADDDNSATNHSVRAAILELLKVSD